MNYVVKWYQFYPDVMYNFKTPVQERIFSEEKDARKFAQRCFDDPMRAVHKDSLKYLLRL